MSNLYIPVNVDDSALAEAILEGMGDHEAIQKWIVDLDLMVADYNFTTDMILALCRSMSGCFEGDDDRRGFLAAVKAAITPKKSKADD